MAWSADLETSHPGIDEQHKALIEAFNHLCLATEHGRGREEVRKTLLFLTNYTVQHFRMEESLMDNSGYPEAARHKQLHHDLVVRLSALMKDYLQAPNALTANTLSFLQGWLVEHIRGEDHRLAVYLRSRG
jgi:hemerythrin-like metal-binding protein